MKSCDVAIVGAGIVGLATAWQLMQRFPRARIIVLEKAAEVAAHQSGHNSGVMHSGIYYKPGSLKAENCRLGKLAMEEFCTRQNIPFELCGKVIVAVDSSELPRLQNIYERGQANGVDCRLIGSEELKELEPHARGVAAIHVARAGIVDYAQVCRRLAELLQAAGHELLLKTDVRQIDRDGARIRMGTSSEPVECRFLITCGGLWADRLIRLSGERPVAPIVPFRGEFFELKPQAYSLCRNLIYPVPDPAYPFLGVHFTRTIAGKVECGPNAVLAFARNGYQKTDLNLHDLLGTLGYVGFQRMVLRNWKTGLGELWRSWNKAAFVRALQRLVPEIQASDLVPAPSGVRAQALGADGTLVDDFVIQRTDNMVHVGNAPSPAATASLQIGRHIADQLNGCGLE